MSDSIVFIGVLLVILYSGYKLIYMDEEEANGMKMVILNIFKYTLYSILLTGWIANFFAIYEHWNNTITIGYLAEFIGVIIFPLGILTGWIHIFSLV